MKTYSCALITGASAGLGEEFAIQLAPICEVLILVARREDRLDELKARLEANYPHLAVHILAVDLADRDLRNQLISRIGSIGLTPDLLVNNAGLGDYGEFIQADWSKTELMMEVNMTCLTHLTHAFLPAMLAQGKGGILNVSSLASLLPIPDFAVYAATKSYVSSFSEALRIELKDTGVNVTALCPGPVHTEFGDVAKREDLPKEFSAREMVYVDKEQVVSDALVGIQRNRPRVYPGLLVAAAALGIGLLPVAALRLVMGSRPRRILPD